MPTKIGLKKFVQDFLTAGLPENYCYHNLSHTLHVTEKVLEIGKEEGCVKDEMVLLYAAALFHDTGFVKTYKGHEEASCAIAKENLPDFGYSPNEIDKICGMIMATKIPQTPKNKLEKILADADLEHLGTDHAAELANQLFIELQFLNPELTREEWNKKQIEFLKQHQYFTNSCIEKREPNKQKYLKSLEKNL